MRRTALAVAVTLTLVLSSQIAPPPAAASAGATARSGDRLVPVSKAKQAAITRNKALPKWQAAPVSWPSAASTVVDLAPQSGGGRMGRATIGGLPITVASVDETAQLPAGRSVAPADTPGQVRVEVLDHARSAKADVPLALRLTRPDGRTTGKVRVTVDYSSFRDAFGADYANRLGIAVLADCAATTPQNLGCRDRKPVPSAVDTKGMTVSAEVDLSAVASTVDAPPLSAPAPVDQTRQNSVTTAVVPQQGAIAKAVPPSEPTNNGGEPVERNVRSAQNVGGVVMAVTAGAGSEIGDFSRTTLSQSASWQAGGPSAAFTWSYPITVPPVEGGLVPAVALGYSSAAVDGQTANNNTQPSWIGEGFSYEPGYIERSYTACKDDTSPVAPYWSQTATMSDLCWRVPNASLVWNGHATELIPDDASSSPNTATPTVWHLADDDGTKVEYLWDQGTARTGYWHDEHWKLTTKDGTQYFFGLSAVPGRSAYTQTLSVLGEGIMGNHAGEPCFSSSAWNLSWCRIAYRWNLDYVVDPHGNAMAYFYNREANNQMIYGGSSTLVGYYRYATLDRIEYGMRAGSGDYPAARILFTSADRCWSGASTCAANHDAARWPDVPWDLDCQASPCGTPSYWTTKRLVKIETQVYRDALGHMPPTGFGWDTIDSYNLASTAPDTMHSGSTPVLVLNSLTHDGTDAGIGDAVRTVISSPLPSVVFNYAVMQNRAVLHTGDTESWKYRIASILNETGGATNVAYNALDPGCTGQTAPVFETNSSRCFPQMFQTKWSWWHKYTVSSVTEKDLVAGGVPVTHWYQYLNSDTIAGKAVGSSSPVLWHHDMRPYASWEHRTWNQWAGYAIVIERTGGDSLANALSKTERIYFRGMYQDWLTEAGTLRFITIQDTDKGVANDLAERAGFLKEEIRFADAGATAPVLTKTFHDPWMDQTGARTLSTAWAPAARLTASLTAEGWNETWTWIPSTSTWRKTRTDIGHSTDDLGNVVTQSAQGDMDVSGDDQCVTTAYANNTGRSLRRFGHTQPAGQTLANWDAYGKTFTPGDFDGDGKLDLLAVGLTGGALWLLRGDGSGGFGLATSIDSTRNWGLFTQLLSPGDFTSDGKPDVIAGQSDGTLLLFRGNGTGGFAAAPTTIGTGWDVFDLVFSVGDFAANGVGDVLARKPNGDLYLYSGDGSGGWTNGNGGTVIGSDWNAYKPTGYKDYNGDGRPDIVAQGPGGLWVYPGIGNGLIGSRAPLTAYAMASSNSGTPIAVGDITADGSNDLLFIGNSYLAQATSAVTTNSVLCTQAMSAANTIAATRLFYDGSTTVGAAPAIGDVTQVDQVREYVDGTPTWTTTRRSTYDTLGRVSSATDGEGNTTLTSFHDNGAGLVTDVWVSNALGQVTATQLSSGRGLPLTVTDANGKVTTGQYDELGRLRKVWRPGRALTATPNAEYFYFVDGSNAVSVGTVALLPDGSTAAAYDDYDGLLRPRQTTTPLDGNRGGFTDTQYDTRGLVAKQTIGATSVPPEPGVFTFNDGFQASQHRYTYDGLGRPLTDELWSLGANKWNITSTTYGGDRVNVDAAGGGTDTTTVIDALGRTTELWEYTTGSTTAGDHTVSRYSYDHAGQMIGLTGPDGAAWTYGYDLLGRRTSAVDPDAGTLAYSYYKDGSLKTSTDGRGQVILYKYDALGRKTGEFDTTETEAKRLAGWSYDTVAIGQLSSSTRYVGGNQVGGKAYTTQVTAYDDGYRPLHTDLIIPSAEGVLAGTYGTDYTYYVDGSIATQKTTTKSGAAVGGLPAETMTYTYNSVGQPLTLSGAQTYLASAAYSFDGQTAEQILGAPGKQVRHTFIYDGTTRRLSTSQVDVEATPGAFAGRSTDTYSFDQAGNVQSIAGQSNGATDQVECFKYDNLRRLKDAWTQTSTSGCTTPQKTGADAYRLSWEFDSSGPVGGVVKTAGLRTKETSYNADGTVLSQSTYNYAGTGTPLHAVRSITTTGAGAGTKTYSYDAGGNTIARPSPGGAQQTLHWDAVGNLDKVTDTSDTTMVYDADGARLLRRDPGGYATLTLTDGTELRANPSGSVAGTRYYADLATRSANVDASGNLTSGSTLTWTITDHHGTGNLAVNSTTLQCDRRRSLPYGGARGSQANGFGTRGFVGGTADPTGLTQLGARPYDPTTGQFQSVDPMLNHSAPQSWNGYAYAESNPLTLSDPSGLDPDDRGPCGAYPGGTCPPPPPPPPSHQAPPPPPPAKHCGDKGFVGPCPGSGSGSGGNGKTKTIWLDPCFFQGSACNKAQWEAVDCTKMTTGTMFSSPGACFQQQEANIAVCGAAGSSWSSSYLNTACKPPSTYTPPTTTTTGSSPETDTGDLTLEGAAVDLCFLTCLGIDIDGYGISLKWTETGIIGAETQIWFAAESDDEEPYEGPDRWAGCVSPGLGICMAGPPEEGPDRVALAIGEGLSGGMTHTWRCVICWNMKSAVKTNLR